MNAGSKLSQRRWNLRQHHFERQRSYNLSPPTSGTYAGIVIFQTRDNTKGHHGFADAASGMTGTIYAPRAQLAQSGKRSA